jgi:hypothetical protein
MNIGKALAVSAVAGMMLGTVACGGNNAAPAATDPSATEKKSCSGDKTTGGAATPASSGDKKSCSH